MGRPVPGDAQECAECERLRRQAREALFVRDESRLTDLRVLQRRHDAAEHGGPRADREQGRGAPTL